jgi:hypothetical protein
MVSIFGQGTGHRPKESPKLPSAVQGSAGDGDYEAGLGQMEGIECERETWRPPPGIDSRKDINM